MVITSHYMDEQWEIKNVITVFALLLYLHTGERLRNQIFCRRAEDELYISFMRLVHNY